MVSSGTAGTGAGEGGFFMAIVRWDPFTALFPLRQMMQFPQQMMGEEEEWLPKIDVYDQDNDLVVKAEMPGMKTEDIQVRLDEGMLIVSGKRQREEKIDEKDYYRMERTYGSFMRSIPVPSGTKQEDVDASYENGVLEVQVRGAGKVEESRQKSIPVRSGQEGRQAMSGKREAGQEGGAKQAGT